MANGLDSDQLNLDNWRFSVPVQLLDIPLFSRLNADVYLLRVDKVSGQWRSSEAQAAPYAISLPPIAGNKLFKLLPNLRQAMRRGHQRVLSFGGPWSNHLHAFSLTAQHYQLQSIGVVRGARPLHLTDTLEDASRAGMQLHFVSRQHYREMQRAHYTEIQAAGFGDAFVIPAGGSSRAGVEGACSLGAVVAQCIAEKLPNGADSVFVAVGTGATLAGIIAGAGGERGSAKSIREYCGVNVLRNPSIEADVRHFMTYVLPESGTGSHAWRLFNEDHCGGYARVNRELKDFISSIERQLQEPFDQVYMAKTLLAVKRYLAGESSAKRRQIAVIHTGGQQGRRGLIEPPFSYRR